MDDYLIVHTLSNAPLPSALLATVQDRMQLRTVFSGGRVSVLAGDQVPLSPHPAGSGIILGDVFPSPPTAMLTPPSAPPRLTNSAWGDYIAVLDKAATGQTELETSPFGHRLLFRAQHPKLLILGSSPALLASCGLLQPRVDWSTLRRFLVQPDLRDEATCLAGLTRVPPGTRLTIDRSVITAEQAWRPGDHLSPAADNPAPSSDDLESVIDRCVADWSGRCREPLVELSGGLDSSIIAAALKRQRGTFQAITIVPKSSDGDEWAYARALAKHLDVPLAACHVDADEVPLSISPGPLTAQPGPHLVAQYFDTRLAAAATDFRSDAFFNGGGGDNLFCRITSAAPVVDRFLSGASSSDVWKTVRDIAALTGSTYWAVCRNAAARYRDRARDLWLVDSSFVAGRCEQHARVLHPWMIGLPSVPGTRRHIRALAVAQSYADGFARHRTARLIFPLLSQPIVEMCLAIPTWRWVEGGRDRAVARQAFARRMPPELVTRRTKGTLDGLFARFYQLRKAQLRELLFDGLLARHCLLDATAIEAEMRGNTALVQRTYYRLIELAGYELWARKVEGQGVASAAA